MQFDCNSTNLLGQFNTNKTTNAKAYYINSFQLSVCLQLKTDICLVLQFPHVNNMDKKNCTYLLILPSPTNRQLIIIITNQPSSFAFNYGCIVCCAMHCTTLSSFIDCNCWRFSPLVAFFIMIQIELFLHADFCAQN